LSPLSQQLLMLAVAVGLEPSTLVCRRQLLYHYATNAILKLKDVCVRLS
jgi:hypothetical protein